MSFLPTQHTYSQIIHRLPLPLGGVLSFRVTRKTGDLDKWNFVQGVLNLRYCH